MNEKLEAQIETFLYRIESWSRAYPVEVFPKPDWSKANEILKQHGMGVTSLAADSMRHVVESMGAEAKLLLTQIEKESEADNES